MKKVSVILMAIAILAISVQSVFGFWANVNQNEVWLQFYNYFSVSYYGQSISFDMWQNEALATGNYDKTYANGYMGSIVVTYDSVNDNFFVDEIVDVPNTVCYMDSNCYDSNQIVDEYYHFANAVVSVANARESWENTGIDGEVWQGFFDYNEQDNTPIMFAQYSNEVENWILSQHAPVLDNVIYLPMVTK